MKNEELVALLRAGIDREANLTALYLQNRRLLQKLVNQYYYEKDDLLQEATLAFLECVRRYDAGKGVLFTSYLVACVDGHLKRFLKASDLVKIPDNTKQKLIAYNKLRARYISKGAQMPDDGRIMAELELSPIGLENVRQAEKCSLMVSLDAVKETEDGGGAALADILTSGEDYTVNTVDDIIENEARNALYSVLMDEMNKTLTDAEKRVILAYYADGKSLEEVGNTMNRTRERIRQIRNSGLKKLRTEKLRSLFIDTYGMASRGVSSRVFESTWTSSTEFTALLNISAQEADIVYMRRCGLTNAEIAKKLGISIRTVQRRLNGKKKQV